MLSLRRIRPHVRSAGILLALMPALAALGGQTNVDRPGVLQASRLIGMTVESMDGQVLGKVKDFVLDWQAARVQYVVIASGGFLGFGIKLKVAPPELMSAATALRNTLALDFPGARWKSAPAFDPANLDSLYSRARKINEFYGKAGSPAPSQGLSPTGTRFSLASDLIGRSVLDRSHEELGEILDLLLDLKSRAVLAIVSSGKLFENGEQDYAAFPKALIRQDNGSLILDADRDELEHAPGFTEEALHPPSPGAPLVFKYTERKEDYGQNQFIGRPASS